eukprot:scaffold3366_cov365-Prasinococcus_capsulatus_cf.AAC.6
MNQGKVFDGQRGPLRRVTWGLGGSGLGLRCTGSGIGADRSWYCIRPRQDRGADLAGGRCGRRCSSGSVATPHWEGIGGRGRAPTAGRCRTRRGATRNGRGCARPPVLGPAACPPDRCVDRATPFRRAARPRA